MTSRPHEPSLARLVALAFSLGILGFGGGYAVAQRVRRAVVDDRQWMSSEEFFDAFSVASSLPGTTATNLFTVLGHRLAGLAGASIATAAFLAPSVVLMIAFGAAYDHLRSLDAVASMLDGMGAATVGVVAAVAVDMRSHGVKNRVGWILAVGATVALTTRALSLLEVVAIGGAVGATTMRPPPTGGAPPVPSPGTLRALVASAPIAIASATPILALAAVFGRIGVATFGGGVAMISPMEHEVVQVHHWLAARIFNDAIVLGQITPGPIAITATFIGYRVAGTLGALVATLAMFGPPFALTVAAARALPAFRTNRAVRGFFNGVAPVIVGAIAAAAVALARSALHDRWEVLIAAGAFGFLVWRPRSSPVLALIGGAALEVVVQALSVHGR
jgi:chromate transporter